MIWEHLNRVFIDPVLDIFSNSWVTDEKLWRCSFWPQKKKILTDIGKFWLLYMVLALCGVLLLAGKKFLQITTFLRFSNLHGTFFPQTPLRSRISWTLLTYCLSFIFVWMFAAKALINLFFKTNRHRRKDFLRFSLKVYLTANFHCNLCELSLRELYLCPTIAKTSKVLGHQWAKVVCMIVCYFEWSMWLLRKNDRVFCLYFIPAFLYSFFYSPVTPPEFYWGIP